MRSMVGDVVMGRASEVVWYTIYSEPEKEIKDREGTNLGIYP